MSSTAKSVPTAHSTPAQPSTANFEAQAKTSESPELSNNKEIPAPVAPKPRLAFPLLLTVLAILPLSFGLGSAKLKASSSRISPSSANTSDLSSDEPGIELVTIDRKIGDRELIEHRYDMALKYYRSLGSPNYKRLPPELLYRIALCQEALGLWDEALVSYQRVSEIARLAVLRAAACYGEARVWFRLNTPEQAEVVLRSMVFRSDEHNRLPRTISREATFLMPLAMAQKCVEQTDKGTAFPLSQLLTWSVETALDWANGPEADEAPDQDHEQVDDGFASHSTQCRIHRSLIETSKTTHVDDWTADLKCNHLSVRDIVELLAWNCGWNVNWSGVKDDQSLLRKVSLCVENRPIWSLMTILCSELRASWSLDGDQLTITQSDPDGSRTRQMMVRTLSSLAVWSPNDRLAGPARFALGELAQYQGEITQAADIFASIVNRESSTVSIRAAYSAAFNYYRLGDFPRACAQLRFVVDAAPEQNLHIEALILLAKLLVDQGEPQEAAFHLRRALRSRSLPDQQARAGILLGLTFLVQERYEEAADAVFANKSQLDEPGLRYAAAFVTSFARWHIVTGEVKEREVLFLYRSLTAVKNDGEWLGQMGQFLIGQAYSELGFDELMADLYLHNLTNGVTVYVESEMTYSLARYESSIGHADGARLQWLKLADGPSSRWKERSKMKLAELALEEKQFQEAVERCQSVVPDETVTRSDVYKLMGRAYEEQGDHLRAARCYAGLSPNP